MTRFKFDGQSLEVRKKGDSNGDGIPDVGMPQGIVPVNQPTELGETLKELNNDDINPSTRMSAIDLKTKLNSWERNSCTAIDWLVASKIMPRSSLLLTQQIKRLNCSVAGWRANQMVELVVGKREHDAKANQMGIMDKTKSFLGMKPKTEGGAS